ncbi:MAG: BrnT family toxin [Gemmatimonadota bacterium]|nr:BrnT family toxin [Gemmatimonadota bacterium]
MEFEFDDWKSVKNKEKHGIDFIEAQQIWEDSELIEIPARAVDEPRFLVIGRYRGTHWSGIVTYRAERVRIISVRRSRKEEIEIYESEGA